MPTITRIANDHLTVDISSLGAEMQALTSDGGRSWLWNGDATFWSGRSPILFPMVGKAPDDTVTIDGECYSMSQHGFARRREFELIQSTGNICRHELRASAETRAMFPFDFSLIVQHALLGNALTVSAEVRNLDQRTMPFGLGFHPAFVWPLPGAEGRPHVIALDNGAEPALARIKGGLVRPDRLPSPFEKGRLALDHAMFEDDAMIFPTGAGAGLRYGVEDGSSLHFAFKNLPNLALWTKPGAPFLCIEPWHGTAAELDGSDDLAKRPYSELLQAGGNAFFAFTVEIPE